MHGGVVMAFETVEDREVFRLWVAEQMAEGKDLPMACYCVMDGKNTKIEMITDGAEVNGYDVLYRLIRIGRITGPICIVAESYMMSVPKKEEWRIELLMQIPPNVRPYTKEVVICTFHDIKGVEVYFSKLEVIKGNRVYSNWELMKGEQSGSMISLYNSAKSIHN